MHPLLLILLIDELFTHRISLSITFMLMGTQSIKLSIIIIDPQKSTIPITLPLLVAQILQVFIPLPITGKMRHTLLNFWQLSVPIFITHSPLQRVNNPGFSIKILLSGYQFLHRGNQAKPYALISKTYALTGKYANCACTKAE